MNTTNRFKNKPFALLALSVLLGGLLITALAATSPRLVMNGKTASTNIQMVNGSPYVKVSDVARALGMVVVKRGDEYEIKKPGGATPIQGVTQGKIGDVLFDGKWRFQVLKMESLDSYSMKTDSDTYGTAGLAQLDRNTHVLRAKDGYKLVVVQCRVTNGQNSKQRLWTAISDDKVNTALTDMQGASHPPVVYDYQGGNIQTEPMIPGAIMTFPVIFSVPAQTQVKDLVFTLHANSYAQPYNNVRVSLK